MRLRFGFWMIAVSAIFLPGAFASDPVSAFLDKLSDKAKNVVQDAGGVGSLLISKAARDVQLEIMAARIQLHDELGKQWDTLDQQKVSVLKAMDSSLDKLHSAIGQVSRMQDDLVLDVDSTLNKIPFLKETKTIRRIWGASQYFRPNGIYIVTIHGNIFDAAAGSPDVTIGGRRLTTPPIVQPPYDVRLEIPATLLNDRFRDRKVTQVPVIIKQKVAGRSYSFQLWRDEFVTQEFTFQLELFPKFPAAYRVTEYNEEPAFDQSRTLVWPRRETLIPGCGDSGCNAYYQICEDVPPGNQPMAAINFYDSRGVGWYSGFANPVVTSTGVCATYWQHSHNTARNVGFDVQYHPATTTIIEKDIELVPISGENLARYFSDDIAAAKDKPVQNGQPPSSGYAIVDKGIDHGAVRIGQGYNVRFDANMKSFTLVMRTFTGEELYITPAKGSEGLDASPLENTTSFKRMTVALKAPW